MTNGLSLKEIQLMRKILKSMPGSIRHTDLMRQLKQAQEMPKMTIEQETAEHITKTFNEAPFHEPVSSVKRYMHDKLHCRMSEDDEVGDWVLFEDVSALVKAAPQYVDLNKESQRKMQPDEIYEWVLARLKSGTSIDTIRSEVEAAYRLYLQITKGHQ